MSDVGDARIEELAVEMVDGVTDCCVMVRDRPLEGFVGLLIRSMISISFLNGPDSDSVSEGLIICQSVSLTCGFRGCLMRISPSSSVCSTSLGLSGLLESSCNRRPRDDWLLGEKGRVEESILCGESRSVLSSEEN